MNRKLPPEALAFYLGLGSDRSYAAVADRFGVSKTAVSKLATTDGWPDRAREFDEQLSARAVQHVTESLEEMAQRHLKIVKAIQSKALEALKNMSLTSAMDAIRALDKAISQERLIRGEPTDRTALSVEDVIRNEYQRWMDSDGSTE